MKRNIVLSIVLVGMGMSLSGQYLAPPVRQNAQPRPAAPQYVDVPSYKRDMAHVLADMRVIQEDFKLLVARIEALEAERSRTETLIRELQETIAMYERRLQAMEQRHVKEEARLRQEFAQTIDKLQQENQQATQQALDSLRQIMVAEISRVEKIAVKAANASHQPPKAVLSGSYKEVKVEPGDTLSSIANSAGISVQTLRQVNGLKNDIIRAGQILKVPVPQQ
ncbi:MAG: LysM peptidoglycan-binding domain-containing protein [Victivallales bacterium]|nr:LysM peptidoglycan-binding domain-containing protein [Victivallales bacterium]